MLDTLNKKIKRVIDSFDPNYDFTSLSLMSDFSLACLERYPELIKTLCAKGTLNRPLEYLSVQNELKPLLQLSLLSFKRELRLFRKIQFFRIAYRALILKCDLEETLAETSFIADCCCLTALEFASQYYRNKQVELSSIKQAIPELSIIALGKLGGGELNFSSDIDLVLAYESGDEFAAFQASIQPFVYFTKVARLFVQLLAENTADGQVFRVDLRLRPNGNSGPLVMSYLAMECYYQEQGRDWERYAILKARIINRNASSQDALQSIFNAFVYRRYIDYSSLEALRSLKGVIRREVQLKQLENDLKRGPGGIREIEFICQSFQLLRGGRCASLQTTSLLQALNVIEHMQLLTCQECQQLKKAYIFLRRLENALQMYAEQQTHALPNEALHCLRISMAMGFKHWPELISKLSIHQQAVTAIFESILNEKNTEHYNDKQALLKQLLSLWDGGMAELPAEDLLLSLGFQAPAEALKQLRTFADSYRCKHLSQIALLRLRTFIPLLLVGLSKYKRPDTVLLSVIRLLEGVVKRSAYLALLIENPLALQHLLKLFSLSPWVAEQVSAQPFLLEVLIDESLLEGDLSYDELNLMLKNHLRGAKDTESVMEILRHFKLSQYLKVAAAQLCSNLTTHQVSRHLTVTAEVILQQVVKQAVSELTARTPDYKAIRNQFLVIAYGKLGSAELGYDSDLDIVFLHNADLEKNYQVTRLAQKVLKLLNMRTYSGVLYQVDTRLRPSGSAGTLVSHIDSYAYYQQENAWTWEHQALVRARAVVGCTSLIQRFNAIRKRVLSAKREKGALTNEINSMREKVANNHPRSDRVSWVKYSRGGLVDLEFLIQFLLLRYANCFPSLTEIRQTHALIVALVLQACITKSEGECLIKAFDSYCQAVDELLLSTVFEEEGLVLHFENTRAIWNKYLKK